MGDKIADCVKRVGKEVAGDLRPVSEYRILRSLLVMPVNFYDFFFFQLVGDDSDKKSRTFIFKEGGHTFGNALSCIISR